MNRKWMVQDHESTPYSSQLLPKIETKINELAEADVENEDTEIAIKQQQFKIHWARCVSPRFE